MQSSTSQLFTVRNNLNDMSFQSFQKQLQQSSNHSFEFLINLALLAFEKKRKDYMQYFELFVRLNQDIVHFELKYKRRILEEMCENGKYYQVRDVIKLLKEFGGKNTVDQYQLHKLIIFAIVNCQKNIENGRSIIEELYNNRNMFMCSKVHENLEELHGKSLISYAIELKLFSIANLLINLQLVQPSIDDLVTLSHLNKWNKKDLQNILEFIRKFAEHNKSFNSKTIIADNRTFIEFVPRDHQATVQSIFKEQQRKKDSPSNKHHQNLTKSHQNKVRSSFGGDNQKPYNQRFDNPSKEKIIFKLQTPQDELSLQKQANKIYENLILEKERHFKYEKSSLMKQKKQIRTGIIKSEQLRYYLQQDIKYQVDRIKQENDKYRPYYLDLISKIKQLLVQQLGLEMQVFGSFETSLCLSESDIDMVVLCKDHEGDDPLKVLQKITQTLECLIATDEIASVKLIKSATVPIIKVTCSQKYCNKKIDITYRDDNHNGLESVKLIKYYLATYPQLQSLIFVLKKFIYASNLFAPYKGGLSSYGLILMIVAFIQQQQAKNADESTADLLIGFLKFYGYNMNYVMKCIRIVDPMTTDWSKYTGCLLRYSDPENSMIDLQPKLVIIDPLNEDNNVGRSTHKIKLIQMAFEIAFIDIHTFRNCGKKKRCQSYKNIQKVSVDIRFNDNSRPCCILKRMFNCTKKFIKE